MEIERKFLVPILPDRLEEYPHYEIEQGYLSTKPVLRIRATGKMVLPTENIDRTRKIVKNLPSDVRVDQDTYSFVYKSSGLMAHEEVTLPLTEESYNHLKGKCDGKVIEKTRYIIPLEDGYEMDAIRRKELGKPSIDKIRPVASGLKIELDLFSNVTGPDGELIRLLEVEFPSEEAANNFSVPDWFGEDVTGDYRYHNSAMIDQL